jgi:hypothetical protein
MAGLNVGGLSKTVKAILADKFAADFENCTKARPL